MKTSSYGHIKTEIGVNPIKYNVAISSINARGGLGELNLHVLNSLGYNPEVVEEFDLSKGYYLLEGKKNKPILFIVTVGDGNVGVNLKKNLFNALEMYQSFLGNRNVWIPLMGTGSGNLDFVGSYDTTIGVLKQFSNINFTIAIPKSKKGEEFIANFRVDNFEEQNIFEDRLDRFDINIKDVKKKDLTESITNNSFDKLKEIIGNPNYFVAGHLWDGEDQMVRFIAKKIWENGHDVNDTNAVNSANKNDIIFIKTTYAKNSISYLRIKAIGVIIGNKKDGQNLEVNWHVFDKHIDIENLGKYRRTFARVSDYDIDIILSNIFTEAPSLTGLINNLKAAKSKKRDTVKDKIETEQKSKIKKTTITVSGKITVAGLISDADSGTDYLDINKDVNAFAKVMAAKSFNPPLAIALLGKWGSGKSFFMRKLKERIQLLSTVNNASKAYCGGIAHVHFNAWSYMDANLWAGIITKIFEGLQGYISKDTLASPNKKKIEKELTKKLNIAHDALKNLEQKKESITHKIKSLESQKGDAEASLKSKIDKIKHKSLKNILSKLDKEFKISEKVTQTLGRNESFNKSAETFSKIVHKEYWQNPTELYKKTKSIYTHIKTFFKGTTWKSNLIWIGFIAILVIIIKVIVFFSNMYLLEKDFNFSIKNWSSITIISGFIIRNIQTIKQLQPIVASFYKIKEDYELQKKDVVFKVNQKEKGLKLEIENHKNEIQSISQQINKAQESKAEIESRLENTLTTEALFSFIEKRADSNDYKKHLGIVSTIRKDFEILSELFSGHNDELKKSEESKKFQKQFERPLERIILYIDDLDRCPNDRVVQVLEAVNLLMAYPLFVVVVGVDPRWVKNALDEKHSSQFGNQDNNISPIEPSGYLEKIFQIPFQLKSANDSSVKHMLRELAETSIIDDSDNYKENKKTNIDQQENINSTFKENVFDEDVFEDSPEVIIKDVIESIKFSDKELELIQSMSPILGTNPRVLKRYVNIYRVIKAHEDFRFNDNNLELEILTVVFLIALPIGKYKALYKSFSDDFVRLNETYTLATYLLEHTLKDDYDTLNEAKNNTEENLKVELYTILNNISKTLLNQNIEEFRKHHLFIKRFTFNNL
jgi:hypothetical protein